MSHAVHDLRSGGVPPAAEGAAAIDRTRLIGLSLLAGLVLALVWSFEFVDGVIGDNVANTLLGYDAKATAITSLVAGLAFAFVSGLACTFTACNIAAMSMVAPLVDGTGASGRPNLRAALRPLGWLAAGAVAISAVYGALGVALRDRLPQLSDATLAGGMPVRLVQSSVVFGIIGLAFLYLGLAALGVVRDPLADRHPRVRLLVAGAFTVIYWDVRLPAMFGWGWFPTMPWNVR